MSNTRRYLIRYSYAKCFLILKRSIYFIFMMMFIVNIDVSVCLFVIKCFIIRKRFSANLMWIKSRVTANIYASCEYYALPQSQLHSVIILSISFKFILPIKSILLNIPSSRREKNNTCIETDDILFYLFSELNKINNNNNNNNKDTNKRFLSIALGDEMKTNLEKKKNS